MIIPCKGQSAAFVTLSVSRNFGDMVDTAAKARQVAASRLSDIVVINAAAAAECGCSDLLTRV